MIQSEFPALGEVISMATFSVNLFCNVVTEMLQKVERLTSCNMLNGRSRGWIREAHLPLLILGKIRRNGRKEKSQWGK